MNAAQLAAAGRRRYDPSNLTRGIDEAIAHTENPHHLAILRNYRRHAIFEVTGNWRWILTPEMTVEHPHYRITQLGETLVLDGMDAVARFYARLAEGGLAPLFGPIEESFMVADWGFTSYGLWGHQMPGSVASEQGLEVDDPDADYYLTHIQTMLWIYDETARLVGENIFEDIASRCSWKLSAEETLSLEEAHRRMQPFLDEELARSDPRANGNG